MRWFLTVTTAPDTNAPELSRTVPCELRSIALRQLR